jgi:hypothetical protein
MAWCQAGVRGHDSVSELQMCAFAGQRGRDDEDQLTQAQDYQGRIESAFDDAGADKTVAKAPASNR